MTRANPEGERWALDCLELAKSTSHGGGSNDWVLGDGRGEGITGFFQRLAFSPPRLRS
jgi:hypothetical protein